MSDAEFARRSRERCQPVECTGGVLCWVALGTAESAKGGKHGQIGTPRCSECSGIIRERNWRGPGIERPDALGAMFGRTTE